MFLVPFPSTFPTGQSPVICNPNRIIPQALFSSRDTVQSISHSGQYPIGYCPRQNPALPAATRSLTFQSHSNSSKSQSNIIFSDPSQPIAYAPDNCPRQTIKPSRTTWSHLHINNHINTPPYDFPGSDTGFSRLSIIVFYVLSHCFDEPPARIRIW